MIDYTMILIENFKDVEWALDGDDYEGLTWLSDTPKPSKAELDALWQSTLDAIEQKKSDAIAARQAILDRLGLTSDEAALLLG